MPIFVSRFSPDRGAVGLLQATRIGGRPEEQEAAQEVSSKPRADQSGGSAQAGNADSQKAVDGRDGLAAVGNTGLALTLGISRTEDANQASNQEAAASTAQGDVGEIAQQLQDQLADSGAVSGQTDASAANTDQEVTPAEAPAAEEQDGAVQTVDAQGVEQKDEAREGQADRAEDGQEAPPPAEVQRERVRSAAREIGSGLRRDAEIQNSRNVEETSRNATSAAKGGQRQKVRQSQAEAQNLQTERRKLQQEIRQTEQRIRRLQGSASGSGSATAVRAVNTLLTGSSVNVLAQ
jgi:hypothetical protein